MADNSYIKDPAAKLPYTWDWSPWLDEISDTIASTTVTVPDGLTAVGEPVITDSVEPPIVADSVVTQKVEGGTVDGAYRLVCQITTVGGLIDERSIYLTIAER